MCTHSRSAALSLVPRECTCCQNTEHENPVLFSPSSNLSAQQNTSLRLRGDTQYLGHTRVLPTHLRALLLPNNALSGPRRAELTPFAGIILQSSSNNSNAKPTQNLMHFSLSSTTSQYFPHPQVCSPGQKAMQQIIACTCKSHLHYKLQTTLHTMYFSPRVVQCPTPVPSQIQWSTGTLGICIDTRDHPKNKSSCKQQCSS